MIPVRAGQARNTRSAAGRREHARAHRPHRTTGPRLQGPFHHRPDPDHPVPGRADHAAGPRDALSGHDRPADQLLPEEQAASGVARRRQFPADRRHTALPGLPVRVRPRHLESLRPGRQGLHDPVRRRGRGPLCAVRLHPGNLLHVAGGGAAADHRLPFRPGRPERPDRGDRPAACDVRPGQRGLEHLRLRAAGHRLHAWRRAQRHARGAQRRPGRSHPVSRRRRRHGVRVALRPLEAAQRVRQHP